MLFQDNFMIGGDDMDSYAQELSQYYYGVAKQRCRATLRFSSFAKKNKGERKEEKHECFHKSGNLPHCEKIRKDLFRIKKMRDT